eukprot:6205308-Pleurochrysis_carterae.AAC.5
MGAPPNAVTARSASDRQPQLNAATRGAKLHPAALATALSLSSGNASSRSVSRSAAPSLAAASPATPQPACREQTGIGGVGTHALSHRGRLAHTYACACWHGRRSPSCATNQSMLQAGDRTRCRRTCYKGKQAKGCAKTPNSQQEDAAGSAKASKTKTGRSLKHAMRCSRRCAAALRACSQFNDAPAAPIRIGVCARVRGACRRSRRDPLGKKDARVPHPAVDRR